MEAVPKPAGNPHQIPTSFKPKEKAHKYPIGRDTTKYAMKVYKVGIFTSDMPRRILPNTICKPSNNW